MRASLNSLTSNSGLCIFTINACCVECHHYCWFACSSSVVCLMFVFVCLCAVVVVGWLVGWFVCDIIDLCVCFVYVRV